MNLDKNYVQIIFFVNFNPGWYLYLLFICIETRVMINHRSSSGDYYHSHIPPVRWKSYPGIILNVTCRNICHWLAHSWSTTNLPPRFKHIWITWDQGVWLVSSPVTYDPSVMSYGGTWSDQTLKLRGIITVIHTVYICVGTFPVMHTWKFLRLVPEFWPQEEFSGIQGLGEEDPGGKEY